MIPIGGTGGKSGVSPATWLLVLLNAVAFYLTVTAADPQAFIKHWALFPNLLDGHIGWPALASLVTSAFIHGGLLHLAANLIYLAMFGSRVEARLGALLFLLLYFCGALFAGLVHVLANPSSRIPVIGASGAVSAVLGAYTVYFPRGRIRVLLPLGFLFFRFWLPSLLFIALWLASQLSGILVADQGVAWWAHLGGFAFGCFAAFMLRDLGRRQPA